MSTIKPFDIFDILHYNNINLDILTETVIILYYYFSLMLDSMENILQNGQNFVFQSKIILVIFKDIVIILYNI